MGVLNSASRKRRREIWIRPDNTWFETIEGELAYRYYRGNWMAKTVVAIATFSIVTVILLAASFIWRLYAKG